MKINIVLINLVVLFFCFNINAQSTSKRINIESFTSEGVELNKIVNITYTAELVGMQIILSTEATTDENLCVNILSSTNDNRKMECFSPHNKGGTIFSIYFQQFYIAPGEKITVTFTNTDELDILTGSHLRIRKVD